MDLIKLPRSTSRLKPTNGVATTDVWETVGFGSSCLKINAPPLTRRLGVTRSPAPRSREFDVPFGEAGGRRSSALRLASLTVVVTPIVKANRLRKLCWSGAFLLTGRV